MRRLLLTQLESGQTGKITGILGGHGLVNKLSALGIRPGKNITKVSSILMRGPVVARVDNTEVAIGFGVASKIVVEVPEK